MINEVEALGPLLALATWPGHLRNALWIHFLDNEGAKFSLIRGSSRAVDTNDIVHATWTACRQRHLYPWWERVTSKDNPVDRASRGDLRDLYRQGWHVVPARLPDIWAAALLGGAPQERWQ